MQRWIILFVEKEEESYNLFSKELIFMPFIPISSPKAHVYLGLWEITESMSELHSLYAPLIPDHEIDKFNIEERKKQWLAVRVLLKELSKRNGLTFTGIIKDEYNKPFPLDDSYHISISHSGKFAVAIINTKETTGIDIEILNPKIDRIKSKFLSENELKKTENNLKELCTYWSAKEALYKYYGKKKVIFNKELLIYKKEEASDFEGKIIKNDLERTIPIRLITKEDYLIVFCY